MKNGEKNDNLYLYLKIFVKVQKVNFGQGDKKRCPVKDEAT